MNVSLTPELEGFIGELVKSGNYFSASEVVRDGLRLLKERETFKEIKIEELKREIQKGKKAMDEGRYTTIDTPEEMQGFMDNVKKRGQEKLAKNRNTKEIV